MQFSHLISGARRGAGAALLALAVLAAAPAYAQDFVQGWDAYDRGDHETALANFRPLAEQGDIAPQYYLGLMYAGGHGVEQDHVQAAHWFRKAAEQGNPESQYELATALAQGLGVEQNIDEAYRWLCSASLQGHEEADRIAVEELGIVCLSE